ncbi:hypothetical protein Aduo_002958 [Ancylostoma duodenale]
MRVVSLNSLVTLHALFAVSPGAEYNCKNSLISDEWREKVLKVQNNNRQQLAQGKLIGKDKKPLPVAKDMNWLIWDCSLEDTAYALAATCTEPVKAPTDHGTVAKMIPTKSKPCDTTSLAVQAVKQIWKAGLEKQKTQAKVAGNDDFSQMAYSKTNGVGCSYNWCTGKLFLVCVYNQDGTKATNLYTKGKAGETCQSCPAGITCKEWLCPVPITPAPPATSTVCPDAPKNEAKWITDDLRNTALGMHNYYRRLLATGWAEEKQVGYAKWAASMPELAYDCDTELEIMKKLTKCGGKEVQNAKAQANNYKLFKEFETPEEQVLEKVENSTLDFIRDELSSGRTPHSTVKSYARSFLEERLRSGDFLMEYIVRMFYYDFKILHYDFPLGFE